MDRKSKQSTNILEKEYWSGCGSCNNTSPYNTVTMFEDKEGAVEMKKCISRIHNITTVVFQ